MKIPLIGVVVRDLCPPAIFPSELATNYSFPKWRSQRIFKNVVKSHACVNSYHNSHFFGHVFEAAAASPVHALRVISASP